MPKTITETLNDRAYFVAGSHAWERSRSDELARTSVQDAQHVIQSLIDKMGTPKVTGGTTANPENILTIYWTVANINKIAGVYVTFVGDHTCKVYWDRPDGSVFNASGIGVNDLQAIDLPGKLKQLNVSLKHLI